MLLCGLAAGTPLRSHVTRWVCPHCTDGYWAEGERCHHCAGAGVTDDAEESVDPPAVA